MATKDLLVDDSGYWETIETIRESLPEFNIVPEKERKRENRKVNHS